MGRQHVDTTRIERDLRLLKGYAVAMTVMVSTDLGNRMAWFALGLALSLGVGSALPAGPPEPRRVAARG